MTSTRKSENCDEEEKPPNDRIHNVIHSDDLLRMGRYSILLCIFVEVAMLSQLSNTMLMVYAGAAPIIKSCGNMTFSSNEEACSNYNYCKQQDDITFERQFYGITEQFKLLCEDAKLEKMGTSIQMIGVMLGCLVFGQIGDLYGRKKPMMFCLCMCFVFGIWSALSSDFKKFTIFRTILCFFNGGQSTISVVYMIENIPKRSRGYISTLISYSPNVILLGILAFFFQQWDRLVLAISFLTVPAIVILAFLHESPRWLMQKGKVSHAKKVFISIEKFDGVPVSKSLNEVELEIFLENEHNKQVEDANTKVGKQHSFWHLFKTREIMTGTFVIAFTFFATTLINYSIMFNLGAVAGSIYMNSILIGLLRYSISLFSGFLDYKFEKFDRKMCHGICSLLTISIIIAIIGFCLTDTTSTFSSLIRVGVLLSCAMTSQAIIVASIASNELMPTAIRSISYSTAQLFSRFGIVVAPHVFHLNLYTGNDFPVLPYGILLIIGLADFLFFRFLIPETKNKPLEDFIVNRRKTILDEEEKEDEV
uniref:MFS domain-containing protein n=1 Tax=Caenorhabditis tropicalis TaxID=1561998 RepID=A0A1I7TSC4_9PELO